MIKLTGLWLSESENGRQYMVGYFGNAKVMIFRNDRKKDGSKEPDYNMFIVEKEQKKDDSNNDSKVEF